VIQELIGGVANNNLAQQHIVGHLSERIFNVPGGQASGVHLDGQAFKNIAISPQEFHQLRSIGLWAFAQLGNLRLDTTFCCVRVYGSISIAVLTVFLANGNTPLTPKELGERLGRPPQMILRTLSGRRVYKGIRPYIER
jgi:hypothetical protein